MRVTLTVLAISFMITACTTLQGINETIKGDGVPYIPGIQSQKTDFIKLIKSVFL